MPSKRVVEAVFPNGGLSKRLAYQQEPPFTTVDAVNTRPEGVFERRLRGGSRPGLVKAFAEQIAEGAYPIRMLTVMRSHNTEGRLTVTEDFSASLSTDWDAGSWHTNGLMGVYSGQGRVIDGEYRGAVLKSSLLTVLSTDNPYSIECWIDPDNLDRNNTTADTVGIYLRARLADVTPVESECVTAGILLQLKQYAGTYLHWARLWLNVDGSANVYNTILGWSSVYMGSGVLRLTIDGDVSSADWIPDPGSWGPVRSVSLDVATASTGTRVGFGADVCDLSQAAQNRYVYFDNFRLNYFSSAGGIPPEAVVASANGELWRETTAGVMTKVTGSSVDLNADEHLMAVDYLGKLYIADYSNNRISRTNNTGTVTNGRLDAAGVDDWDQYSIDEDNDMVEVSGGSSGAGEWLGGTDGATGGVYGIADTGITAETGVLLRKLSTDTNLGAGDNLSTCNFRIARGPKRYNIADNSFVLWPADDMPLGCRIIEIFRERMTLGGDPDNPGVWYMSRARDPDDWNYGASLTDRARAVAGSTSTSDAGQLPLPLSAIKSITEDYCVFSAESEMYLLRGDPTVGGIMGNVSSQIGIGDRTACCRIPDGSVVFLCRDGLYRFHPSNPFPEALSRDKLPLDLIDVVQNTDYVVSLEYDVRFHGVHVFATRKTVGITRHYWYDWTTQGFWLTALANTNHEPFALSYDAKANHVLLGGRDGYIRRFDAAASTDDGTAINSHVFYGPFSLGGNVGEGAISDIYAVLDDASGDAVIEVLVGDEPEGAYKSAPFTSRTVSAGYSKRLPVRAGGSAAFVKISDSSGSQWAIDSLTLVTQRNGKHRG